MKTLTIWAVSTLCLYVVIAIVCGVEPQEWEIPVKIWFVSLSVGLGMALGWMLYLDSGQKFVDVDNNRRKV